MQINEQFKKRLLSFIWRLGAYLGIAALAWVGDNIGVLELPAYATAIIALVCGEVTKYLNSSK